jgi:single-strand DNA-binding protein
MNFNQAIICGNMTRDPESRTLPSGQPVCSYAVATHRVWTDKAGEKQEQTEFHNVVSFGKQAEFITQYVRKGSLLMIRGRLQTRTWTDAKHPEFKHYRTEIIADTVELGPKRAKQDETDLSTAAPSAPDVESTPDEIPF